jgi:hypothetical protein
LLCRLESLAISSAQTAVCTSFWERHSTSEWAVGKFMHTKVLYVHQIVALSMILRLKHLRLCRRLWFLELQVQDWDENLTRIKYIFHGASTPVCYHTIFRKTRPQFHFIMKLDEILNGGIAAWEQVGCSALLRSLLWHLTLINLKSWYHSECFRGVVAITSITVYFASVFHSRYHL